MKKLLTLVCSVVLFALSGCNTPQIKRDDVSFVGLTKIFVEASRNGEEIFRKFNNQKQVDDILIAEIKRNLTEKGYIVVDKKENAQIIFVPVWSVSVKEANNFDDIALPVPTTSSLRSNGYQTKFYATLELQAFLQGDSHWGWRGFSPIETSAENITSAMLKNQITWTLEFFPPEKYPNPSTPILEIFKSSNVTEAEIAQKKIEQAEIEKQKQIEYQKGLERAKQKAKQKIKQAKKEGKKVEKISDEQIQKQYKPETIESIEKSFERALQKRQQNK